MNDDAFRRRGAGILLVATLSIAAPAQARDVYDPLEGFNRAVFAVNEVLDGLLLEPASEVYGLIAPEPVKRGVRNVVANLGEPLTFANDVLQLEGERAATTLGRFVVNSTAGVFGIFEVSQHFGWERHDEDFGQTLAVWGVGDGPYLVAPLLGPSNARDLVGFAVDFTLNPLNYVLPADLNTTKTVISLVSARHDVTPALEDLERSSLDLYASLRTVYTQRRASEVRNGETAANEDYEDIFDDFDEFDE